MSQPTTMKAVVIKGDHPSLEDNIPLPPLNENHLLVKIRAAAGNPTDWKHIAFKIGPQGSILGCDAAGEVVKLGSKVKGFAVGDVVFSVVHGASVKHPENGAFAQYSVFDPSLTLKVPNGGKLSGKDYLPEGPVTTVEGAVSLPVSLFTAGGVLTHHLGLKEEWEPSKPQNDYPLLIWGGATAVGQLLIQLAKKLHGYSKIIVVASKKHEEKLKGYGADELFDYHDKDVIEQIKAKYNYLPKLIDAVSAPESFTEVYKLGSSDKPTTLLQLTTMSEELIEKKDRNPNVKVEGALLYLISGTEVPFGRFTVPASPSFRADVIKFIKFIGPKIDAGEIHHIPIKIFQNGLEDVPAILKGIEKGENANTKFVTVLK